MSASRRAKQARMSAPDTPDNSDSAGSESEDGDGEKEIQADFEARSPEGEDYFGIKGLLLQLFKCSDVDVAGLSNIIVEQKGVGSVIKQSIPEEEDDSMDDDEVYAISTVLNLSDKAMPAISTVRKFLLDQTSKGNDRQVLQYVTEILTGKVGFIINERFINIPAQITVPLFETLATEMRKARERGLPYDFSHFVMVCKLFKTPNLKNGAASNGGASETDQQAVIFCNPEEELIVNESELCIDYDVSGSSAESAGTTGNWTDDVEMIPWRRIAVFRAEKLNQIIASVRENFPTEMDM